MMEIAGKTAFVTGAASGIGLGIATALSQAGVKVMLCDIEDATLVKAVADLKLTNADVDGVKADVSLKAELQGSRRHNRALWEGPHTSKQCGGWRRPILWSMDRRELELDARRQSDVSGLGRLGPLIEAHGEGGQIVSTASIAGLIAGAGPAYSVTKYGVVALLEGLERCSRGRLSRLKLSTPEQKCIGLPEQKYINDASKKAPETGAFCSGIRLGSDYPPAAYPSWHGVSGACSD